MYAMSIKTSDAPCEILRQEVLNFHISGSLRRRKALEMGNVPLFNLLFKMKFILTRLTRRVFASGLYLSHFYKDARH